MIGTRIAPLLIVAACSTLALEAHAQSTPTFGPVRVADGIVTPAKQASPATCANLQGAWELVSVSVDGKQQPNTTGYRQQKLLTKGHFMWLGHDARRDTLPMRTSLDSLRATSIGGGAGTYTVTGDAYVERLELFVDPSQVGTSFQATCRFAGDRWQHGFTIPSDTTAAKGKAQHVLEVWRRIE